MKKIIKITCTECKEPLFESEDKERDFSESEFANIIETHYTVRHNNKIKLEYEKITLPKKAKVESKTGKPVKSKKESKPQFVTPSIN